MASRRKAEAIILSARVKVNNETVLEAFREIDPDRDHITVDNISISNKPPKHLYIVLHKPAGYISDLKDPKGRSLARDLIPISTRLYPVGRLDYTSEGLIIYTNDGEFAQKVLHPRYQLEKEYLVKIQRPLNTVELERLTTGRHIEGVLYRLRTVKVASITQKNAWYVMIATEGRNRMIRKLAESIGHRVLRLRRVRIGSVMLGSLRPGMWRHLRPIEVEQILRLTSDRPLARDDSFA